MIKYEAGIDDINTWEPDPRLSSPEKTWSLHKRALIEGDHTLLLKCLTPSLFRRQRKIFESVNPDQLMEMGLSIGTIEKITADDKQAKYRTVRELTRNRKSYNITNYIYFTNIFGEWRIAQM
jgi:hypothetical protein